MALAVTTTKVKVDFTLFKEDGLEVTPIDVRRNAVDKGKVGTLVSTLHFYLTVLVVTLGSSNEVAEGTDRNINVLIDLYSIL